MSGQSRTQIWAKTAQSWAGVIDHAGLARFFKAMFPSKTAEMLAERTGYPVPTVRKWLSGEARPGFEACFVLILEFGPEVIAAAVPRHAPAWLDETVRAHETRILTAEIESRRTRLAALRP